MIKKLTIASSLLFFALGGMNNAPQYNEERIKRESELIRAIYMFKRSVKKFKADVKSQIIESENNIKIFLEATIKDTYEKDEDNANK